MNTAHHHMRPDRFRLRALAILSLFAASAALAQTTATTEKTEKKDEPMKLEKFTVTGSFIPVASDEPIGPVAIFSETDIRATGAFTPIQALRSLPSFIGNPGPTENDSNGGNGSTGVSLRGLGAGQTLVLVDGRVTFQFSNIQLIPIEAIERVEVLRDGAGVIYGSAAIGGAVNVILKKAYTGSAINLSAGGATRSPGGRETFQASFVSGAASGPTSILVAGSFFKNRTIFASQRPNSAASDNRPRGGTNGGSPTFPGVIATGGGGTPLVLRPGFRASATPTLADYVAFDTNTFSSSQLFNFREYSPSAPGQKRNSLMLNFEHQLIAQRLTLFGGMLYSKMTTSNGLAPAPFALDADPAGPAVGGLTTFGPYNQGILNPAAGDFFRYRSVELGNRTQQQQFQDFRYQVGLRGAIAGSWNWEAAMSVEDEDFEEIDAGVPSLVLLDAEVQAGRFNPFGTALSKGSKTIGATTYTWDNLKALKASEIKARIKAPTKNRFYDVRVTGSLLTLPAGDLGFAAGWESAKSNSAIDPDDLYGSGGVLGLNTITDSQNELRTRSVFSEIKVPLIAESNRVPFVHGLSVGALARKESQTLNGLNGVTNQPDSRTYDKVNPSVSLHYSPTKDYLVRASWSRGFLAPGSFAVFGASGTSNPTLADPLGFPYTAQTTIVIRSNANLKPATSEATSLGFVGTPKDLVKGLSFSVDLYHIKVSDIVANNAKAILAANAAGQGSGFVSGNAATINPNAPFASQIRRNAAGSLSNSGNFGAGLPRGAVLSDFLNIGSRDVTGVEYTATYIANTANLGRFKFAAAANQFITFDQKSAPNLPAESYLGKFVSTVGDALSPGSIPRWKANFSTAWSRKELKANVAINYIGSYRDDPLFVLSPEMAAFYKAGTSKSDPAFAAFLAAPASTRPKVGGLRTISAFTTVDLQVEYAFPGQGLLTKGTAVMLGATNVFDKLAPFAAGAFNDSYDTRTHNNIGRFVYLQLRKQY